MSSILRRTLTAHNVLRPTVGDSKMSFTDLDHHGWIKCDGRYVNVAEFSTLFKVIGYTFGGSGAQFRLPDMRGRVPGAAGSGAILDDAGRTLSTRTKGQYVGEEVHLLNINEMPAHKHGSVDVSGNYDGNGNTSTTGEHDHGGSTGGGGYTRTTKDVYRGLTPDEATPEDTAGQHTHSIAPDGSHYHTIGSTGGGNVHNNVQPTLFLGNAFIYTGKFNYGVRALEIGSDII